VHRGRKVGVQVDKTVVYSRAYLYLNRPDKVERERERETESGHKSGVTVTLFPGVSTCLIAVQYEEIVL